MLVVCTISVIGSRFALGQTPLWEPSTFIPVVGMMAGNAISGISVGLNYTLGQFRDSNDRIEMYLAHGATRFEASRKILLDGVRMALLPSINQMSVMGLVAIPGTLVGTILGGASIDQAIKYQEILIFLVSSSTAFSVFLTVLVAISVCFDTRDRLRLERIYKSRSLFEVLHLSKKAKSAEGPTRPRFHLKWLMFWRQFPASSESEPRNNERAPLLAGRQA